MRKIFRLLVVSALTLMSSVALAQTAYEAAYLHGRVKELPENKPGKLDVSDANILTFTWDKGSWKVPFAQVKTVYVAMSRRSALPEVFGLAGAAVGEAKTRKLLVSLTLSDETGASRNCVFYVRGAPSPEFWRTFAAKIGRDIIFESAEARKGAEGTE